MKKRDNPVFCSCSAQDEPARCLKYIHMYILVNTQTANFFIYA